MKIEKLDNKGRGITYYNDLIMFVENALPNEEITVKDIKENKKFYEAKVDEIKNNNINRIMPKCPYYNECGGCNLMHMVIEYQEEYKENKLKEILKKYADIDEKIRFIKSDKDLFYRNKLTLKIENGKWGFYNSGTHELIEVNKCILASVDINNILSNKGFINIKNGEITIRSNYKNEILISVFSDEKISLNEVPDNVVGIVHNKKTIYKDNYFFDKIDDLEFKVSYDSFFQINNYVAGKIFEILRTNIKGKNVLDLYCGVGTLGLSLMNIYKNIYGIEKIPNAIKDAKENAKNNNVTNAHFYVGDTSNLINKVNIKIDTVIVDPPRSGLNEKTINEILNINPKTLAYISCDPMTLSRDLKILKNTYKIKRLYALDMFPNTYHVESVVILERK